MDLLHITYDCWKEVADEACLEQHEPSPRDDIEPRSPVRGGREGEVEPTSPVPGRSLLVLVMPVNMPTMPTMPKIATSSTQTHVSGWCHLVYLSMAAANGCFFRRRLAATLCMASPRSRSNLRHDELSQAGGEKSRPNYNMFDRVKTQHGKVRSGNIVSLSDGRFGLHWGSRGPRFLVRQNNCRLCEVTLALHKNEFRDLSG